MAKPVGQCVKGEYKMKFYWLKDGMRNSRKVNKKRWNRRVRHYTKNLSNGNEFKKLAKASAYDMVT